MINYRKYFSYISIKIKNLNKKLKDISQILDIKNICEISFILRKYKKGELVRIN